MHTASTAAQGTMNCYKPLLNETQMMPICLKSSNTIHFNTGTSKKKLYHEKGQYFLSLISESEIYCIYALHIELNISSLYFMEFL